MVEAEVLEVGVPRRRGPSRRARVALLASAVALGVLGFVVDHVVREREQRDVVACADAVSSSVERAGGRVATTYAYVRPALSNAPDGSLRSSLLGLVAESAEGAGDRLAAARQTCSDVDVFLLHSGLRQRRDRCLEVLAVQRSTLAAVAEHGDSVQGWLDAPRSC